MPGEQTTREKWDARYREARGAPPPLPLLSDHAHLLPPTGHALELACGLGANALFLAERGLAVNAWDLSPVAIERLRHSAAEREVTLQAEVRDILQAPPAAGQFDVIVVAHFLDRRLVPAITAALRPGGLLFYQTWSREALGPGGPRNPAFRLARNELLQLFAGLTLIHYHEEGRIGDPGAGWRDQAQLIAQRPD